MPQWAEIRHMHEVGGIEKQEIAWRLNLDMKTERRALRRRGAPLLRSSPTHRCTIDPLRARMEELSREKSQLTAKRISRLLEG